MFKIFTREVINKKYNATGIGRFVLQTIGYMLHINFIHGRAEQFSTTLALMEPMHNHGF